MIFRRKLAYESAILETAQILLDPLREVIPEVVTSVIQDLNGGRTPGQASQVLLQGLIAWRNRVAGEEVKIALLRQDQRQAEIRSKEIEQNKTIVNLQMKINGMEHGVEEQRLLIESLQNTIQNQNSIISEQHNRLVALLGHSRS